MADSQGKNGESSSNRPASDSRSRPRSDLLIAALSAAAALLGALIGGGFTAYTNERGIQNQEKLRAAEVRQQSADRLQSLRVDAYRDFLKTVYAMRGRFNDFLGCNEPLEKNCPAQFRAYYLSQNDMEVAFNVLLVYSSKDGASLTSDVHDKSKEIFSVEILSAGDDRNLIAEIEAWDALLKDFRRQWCRDLNLEPQGC